MAGQSQALGECEKKSGFLFILGRDIVRLSANEEKGILAVKDFGNLGETADIGKRSWQRNYR